MPDINSLTGLQLRRWSIPPVGAARTLQPQVVAAQSAIEASGSASSYLTQPHWQVDAAPGFENVPAPVGLPGLVQPYVPLTGQNPLQPRASQQNQGQHPPMGPWDSRLLQGISVAPVTRFVAGAAARHIGGTAHFVPYIEARRLATPDNEQVVIFIDPPRSGRLQALSVRHVTDQPYQRLDMRMRAAWDVAAAAVYTFERTSQDALITAITAGPNWRTVASLRLMTSMHPADARS